MTFLRWFEVARSLRRGNLLTSSPNASHLTSRSISLEPSLFFLSYHVFLLDRLFFFLPESLFFFSFPFLLLVLFILSVSHFSASLKPDFCPRSSFPLSSSSSAAGESKETDGCRYLERIKSQRSVSVPALQRASRLKSGSMKRITKLLLELGLEEVISLRH